MGYCKILFKFKFLTGWAVLEYNIIFIDASGRTMLLNVTLVPETTNEYGFKLLTFLLRYNNILKKEQWHSWNNYNFCYVINIKILKCFFQKKIV